MNTTAMIFYILGFATPIALLGLFLLLDWRPDSIKEFDLRNQRH